MGRIFDISKQTKETMTTQDRIFADLNQECEALESTLGTCNHQGQLIIADDHQLFECIFENEAGTMTTIFFAWFQGEINRREDNLSFMF